MSEKIIDKNFNAQLVEQEVLSKINATEYYNTDINSEKEPFVIMMPPPNVTGYLHIGHALVNTLQDVLIRYYRMHNYEVLWQGGTDHAGIATQAVVEKQLLADGIKRKDLSRAEFREKVELWKEHSGGEILNQLNLLGASYNREYIAYTMDKNLSVAVLEAFITLHNNGLIYRDNRLVNWDIKLQTAISDLEVEQKEVKTKFYYVRYKIFNSNEEIIVATTRPETILGDTALAVNPLDERYKHLVGSEVIVPLLNKKVVVVADDYADTEKGTGAVKITPAHDFNDFEVGKRHNLEIVNILNKDGTLNTNTPQEFQGLSREEARAKIIKLLEEQDLLVKIEENITKIPYGDRSNTIIEPLLTKQWFVDAKSLAKDAIRVVDEEKIKFMPKSWQNLYFEWMSNIEPWCISRQIWWGHQIPVYYVVDEHDTSDTLNQDHTNQQFANNQELTQQQTSNLNQKYFVAKNLEDAQQQALLFYGRKVTLIQDEDVLDTWFSASLWPFATLGWQTNDNSKLQKFFPSSVLVTAFDIIFFWVARMIMMSLYFMKEIPFKTVYITALIRDAKGQKMSKSKGNVVNPLDLMHEYGTDALRWTLVSYGSNTNDIKLSEKSVEQGRNFVTKIWNAYRFCMQNSCEYTKGFNLNTLDLDLNKWLLVKLQNLEHDLNTAYKNFKFNEISSTIEAFIRGTFCDWYLELVKPIMYQQEHTKEQEETRQVTGFVLERMLKFLHPIMPYLSEYLWTYNTHRENILALTLVEAHNVTYEVSNINKIDALIALISKIRSKRADLNLAPSLLLNIQIKGKIPVYITKNLELVKRLARISEITSVAEFSKETLQDVVNNTIIGIPVREVIDFAEERQRIAKEISKIELLLQPVVAKLKNPGFLAKAKPEVIVEYKIMQQQNQEKLQKLQAILQIMQS